MDVVVWLEMLQEATVVASSTEQDDRYRRPASLSVHISRILAVRGRIEASPSCRAHMTVTSHSDGRKV